MFLRVANSKKVLLSKEGVSETWKQDLIENGDDLISVSEIISFAKTHHFENLIAVDNTANVNFVKYYIPLIEAGFDLVSCNKIANTFLLIFINK